MSGDSPDKSFCKAQEGYVRKKVNQQAENLKWACVDQATA